MAEAATWGQAASSAQKTLRDPWASMWGGWVMDVGHGRVLTTCQIRGSPWQRCWEAWESPRWPREKHREQRQTGRAPGAHTRGRGPGEPAERKGRPGQTSKTEGRELPARRGAQMQTQKGGITLESSPLKRWCLLNHKACEWPLRGSRVFAGDQVKMSSVAWAPRPCKSGNLDTERTQRDDNLKTGEERTRDRSRSPEPPEAVKKPAQTRPQKHQPADTWPGPLASRLGQQSLLSSDPRMLTAGFRV